MSKQLKSLLKRDLEQNFQGLESYVLVDYRGLDSLQTHDLRKSLAGVGVRVKVVPNRIAARVLDRWSGGSAPFRELFRGPTAVVFGKDGALSASKAVVQWKKKNKDKTLLPVKGAVLGNQVLPPAGVESLAKIPDRKALLAQLAGTLQAPLARLACVTQGPLRKVVYALDAHRRKLEEGAAAPAVPEVPATPPAS